MTEQIKFGVVIMNVNFMQADSKENKAKGIISFAVPDELKPVIPIEDYKEQVHFELDGGKLDIAVPEKWVVKYEDRVNEVVAGIINKLIELLVSKGFDPDIVWTGRS